MTATNKYFSTFISGFETVVEKFLKESLGQVKIEMLLDGLVIYSTEAGAEQIKNIKFLSNSFILLRLVEDKKITIGKMMKVVLDEGIKFEERWPELIETFRVVTFEENQAVAIEPRLMVEMERLIIRSFGLRPNRSKPDIQFWFLTRSEGLGLFGARLTQHPDYGKTLERGELRPELANMLCLLSEPKETDVFLDPFAGSAAIARARTEFSYKQMLVGDIEPKNKTIRKMDATRLEEFGDESVDKIVTDPPWGFFGEKIDVNDLYKKTLSEFSRVVKKGGRVVMLVGDRENYEALIKEFSDQFRLEQKLYILVSGKKAGVYVMVRM